MADQAVASPELGPLGRRVRRLSAAQLFERVPGALPGSPLVATGVRFFEEDLDTAFGEADSPALQRCACALLRVASPRLTACAACAAPRAPRPAALMFGRGSELAHGVWGSARLVADACPTCNSPAATAKPPSARQNERRAS